MRARYWMYLIINERRSFRGACYYSQCVSATSEKYEEHEDDEEHAPALHCDGLSHWLTPTRALRRLKLEDAFSAIYQGDL